MEHYFTNNENLKSELRNITYKNKNIEINFVSDLGVFSKDKVDFGSNLLVDSYIEYGRENVNALDLGCGYGFIGIALAIQKSLKFTFADVNKRALHLTNMNLKNNKIVASTIESDMYENIDSNYDVIITNPPIRIGKEKLREFLKSGLDHLNDEGELWFVMKKDHGAKSMIDYLSNYGSVEVKNKSKGFYIIVLKKC